MSDDYDPDLKDPRNTWLRSYFGFLITKPVTDDEKHTASDGFDAGANWMRKQYEEKGISLHPNASGELHFHTGQGQPSGSVKFFTGKDGESTEVLRFDPDGKVFIRGEQVDSNHIVYEIFREWLTKSVAKVDGADVNIEHKD